VILNGELIAFFVFALLTIGGAIFMITFTRVVHMVVAMAFTFLSIGGVYVLLQAEFVAFVQILIYSGAITILMLFGIMMTRHDNAEEAEAPATQRLFAFVGALGLFGIIFFALRQVEWTGQPAVFPTENTKAIGELIYTRFVIPFETVSVLLTVALIGAILLAKREDEKR
jgi:NADH-quinone oxidoreductase subunit J